MLARIKTYELETLAKFSGQQMGEQFGYALLREQFGANGQMASSADILISAPLHQRLTSGEQGVVYVYPKGVSISANKYFLCRISKRPISLRFLGSPLNCIRIILVVGDLA